MSYRLRRKAVLYRRNAHDLILEMTRWGERLQGPGPLRHSTDAAIKRFFEQRGHQWEALVESIRPVRTPPIPIPHVENLLGGTWQVFGGAQVRAEYVDAQANIVSEGPLVEGSGEVTLSNYGSLFETAVSRLDEALLSSPLANVRSAIVDGVASVEAYLNHRANIWNHANPQAPLVDDRANKVRFDDKLNQWVTTMTGGKPYNRGTQDWEDYKVLRGFRDQEHAHVKVSSGGRSLDDLAELMNRFRGLAGMLVDLHKLFGEAVPPVVLRARYAAEVEVVEVQGPR